MARHRSSGSSPARPVVQRLAPAIPASVPTALELALAAYAEQSGTVRRHRAPGRSAALRGRVAVAVVVAGAAGASVTAGQVWAGADSHNGASASATGGQAPVNVTLASASAPPADPSSTAPASVAPTSVATAPNVLPVVKYADSVAAEQLAKSTQMTADRAARAARAAEARRPLYVMPAAGTFTSGFGARWGSEHKGDDIANVIGTPVVSVTDGVVLDAGPASGFGLWVRVQNNDGTIAVYGHVNETIAKVGQRVRAGEEIATIGNRGQSTGPHLHFEIWLNGTDKVDPQPWLASHGLILK